MRVWVVTSQARWSR